MTLSNLGPWLTVPLLLLAFFFGRLVSSGGDNGHTGHGDVATETSQSWTCSMHPQIILPSNDQNCPICFMDLIPLDSGSQDGLSPGDLALSDAGIALANIQTSAVERRFVSHQIPLVGKVTYDETTVHHITARYPGRLEKLYVSASGEKVNRGSKLAEIYSPDLYGAQVELFSAMRSSAAGTPGGKNMVRAARQRLFLLGFDEEQINELAKNEKQQTSLTISAPAAGVVVEQTAVEGMYVKTGTLLYSIAGLDRLWVTLEAFESDLPWLRKGQEVSFSLRSQPGQMHSAVIDFIEPVLTEGTKSIKVRLPIDNTHGLLMPGMLVSANIKVVLDEFGLPVDLASVAQPPLVVPATAVLQAGPESMVYVSKPGEDGVFSGRRVKLGPRAGDYYLILAGLEEGEEVVVRGSFKIDSALQILARPSMMAMLPNQNQNHDPDHISAPVNLTTIPLSGTREFKGRLAELLDRYIELQTFLAADDGTSSRRAALDLSIVLALLQESSNSLTVSENIVWSKYQDSMSSAAFTIATAGAIKDQRISFQPLSDNLWELLTAFGNPKSKVVRRINCPMAMDDSGANWLQFEKIVANPYYGSTMLRCGSEFASLPVEDSK